jgi:hypothetical protein
MNEHQGTFLPATAGPTLADVVDALPDQLCCAKCGAPFTPRQGSGGRPQRFCTDDCRRQFHAGTSPTLRAGVGADVGTASEQPPNRTRIPDNSKPDAAALKPPLEEDEESWQNDETRVLHDQPETFLYINKLGQIVIRQIAEVFEDNPWVRIDADRAAAIAQRMTELAREAAAARQRGELRRVMASAL